MTVLVAGATGFLGSYLVKAFLQKGFTVLVLIRSSSNLIRLQDNLSFIIVCNLEETSLENIFSQYSIDIVVNTVTDYGRNGSVLSSLIETNLLFGLRLLEASVTHEIKAFINTDTLLPKAINPYALSKAQLVDWMHYYADRHLSTKIINIKIEHMYGPKDDKKKFISWFASQLISNVNHIDLTSGIQKRDFIFISDVTKAYEKIIDHLEQFSTFEEFELGSGESIEMKAVIDMITSIIAEKHCVSARLNFGVLSYRQGEQMEMKADIRKLLDLGWKPQTTIELGLKKTLEEYV
uniref:NAD-dependent epimerase/dehydratase family protein n=1 Tax=Sulfuricurvum sp. TaxID=2025608 RepID=UPI0026300705|nr:NAD(P)-dependent oxidoreductase [Sulfuricurvum sp.]MDD3596890.1 NAD(P)-dependent oxidoreductase [Sulfuricurvum sp.]